MVLYKRKPIILPDPPLLPNDLDIKVWLIPETGEWFRTYEEYLNRIYFYNKHVFTCEITGTSCLSFFQAINSEEREFENLESKFPLKLREPVAKFLHFNVVTRLDLLVEHVYIKFKTNFFPGELVLLINKQQQQSITENNSTNNNNKKEYWIVREKAQFNAIIDPQTKIELNPAYSKYSIFNEKTGESKIVDQAEIHRDRSTFTKHLIKCFCKITLTKASPKMGAPWCVKPEYLQVYGLDMTWPVKLLKYKDDVIISTINSNNDQNINVEYKDNDDDYDDLTDNEIKKKYNNEEDTNPIKLKKKRRDKVNINKKTDELVKVTEVIKKKKGRPRKHKLEDPSEPKIKKKRGRKPGSKNKDKNIDMESNGNSEGVSIDTPGVKKEDKKKEEEEEEEEQLKLHTLTNNEETNNANANNDLNIENKKKENNGRKLEKKGKNNFKKNKNNNEAESDDQIKEGSQNTELNTNNQKVEALEEESSFQQPTCITEDTEIPFDPSKESHFKYTTKYNIDLEEVCATNNEKPNSSNFTKLLQIFQFINTFNEEFKISHISFEKLITAFKCTVPRELAGETVHIDIVPFSKHSAKDNVNDLPFYNEKCTRYSKFDKLIRDKNVPNILKYRIIPDDPLETIGESLVDDIEYNGSHVLVEIFCGLLRLFINENMEWTCFVAEEWLLPNDNKITNENFEIPPDISKFLEKVLQYRNVDWTERLGKRQFNNGFWVICLLGVFRDCIHLPMYSDIIINITTKIMKLQNTGSHLNKTMWRNFVWNLSLDEKIDCLWVLLDLLLNFQPTIKNRVESSMELVNLLKSERFKMMKDVKQLNNKLSDLLKNQHPKECADKNDTNVSPNANNTVANFSLPSPLSGTESNENIQEVKAIELQLAHLNNMKVLLDQYLRTNDDQRLKSLGMDRYGNKYWWLEFTGIPIHTENPLCGRLLIQGPSKYELQYLYPEHDDKIVLDSEMKDNNLPPKSLLERKIKEETDQGMLLNDLHWHIVSTKQAFNTLMKWLNTWGTREHQLLKNLKIYEDEIFKSIDFIERKSLMNLPREDEILKELEKFELNTEELEYLNQLASTEKSSSSVNISTDESDECEADLADITKKITTLENSGSKTRVILSQIATLEKQRDLLLEKKKNNVKNNMPFDSNTLLMRSIKEKIREQQQLLTELHNFRHSESMEDCSNWRNNESIRLYGKPLSKGATGSSEEENCNVETKLHTILKNINLQLS
ncbi:uncharacterized protein SCODWIG_02683 [Saccharomycodes ludwigii]|uniref:Imitation switch two complex protein 1 n=1 Tax=Saccharomycodes ludwigii TaxID=36035 RepID=A0A376B8C9_9ASCO|nr:uncharacterized protein SCODWIG_02683 [Saccharomycodes ludwigii]